MLGAGALTVTPHDAVATTAWGERGAAGNPQALNRYSYVNNNPLGRGIPRGMLVSMIHVAQDAQARPVAVGAVGARLMMMTSAMGRLPRGRIRGRCPRKQEQKTTSHQKEQLILMQFVSVKIALITSLKMVAQLMI